MKHPRKVKIRQAPTEEYDTEISSRLVILQKLDMVKGCSNPRFRDSGDPGTTAM